MQNLDTPETTETATPEMAPAKSKFAKAKTAAEVLVLAHTVTIASVGFFQLAKEAKAALREKRLAKEKTEKQEETKTKED